jgi:hypothetical protein
VSQLIAGLQLSELGMGIRNSGRHLPAVWNGGKTARGERKPVDTMCLLWTHFDLPT